MDDKEKVVTETTSPEETSLTPEMEEELSNGKGEE